MSVDTTKIKNLLFVMLGGIGNLILAVPALRALRSQLPTCAITLLAGEPGIVDILSNEQLINNTIVFDRRTTSSLITTIHLIHQIRQKRFDVALVSSSTNQRNGGILTALFGIPIRVGEQSCGNGSFYTIRVPFTPELTHECDGNIRLVEALGVPVGGRQPRLILTSAEEDTAYAFLRDAGVTPTDMLVGLHTGCGQAQIHKRWPREKFIALARMIQQTYGARILLTGTNHEIELVTEIASSLPKPAIIAAGKCPLRVSAALIKCCRLFISNDSGPAHIAAAVATPLIVLFGSTNEKRIAPRAEKSVLLKQVPISTITTDTVWAATQQILGSYCST